MITTFMQKRVTVEFLGFYTFWPLGSMGMLSSFAIAAHLYDHLNILLYFCNQKNSAKASDKKSTLTNKA